MPCERTAAKSSWTSSRSSTASISKPSARCWPRPAGGAEVGFDLTEATRRAHSLKGAARAVGLEQVETLAHRLESLFIDVQKGETPLDRRRSASSSSTRSTRSRTAWSPAAATPRRRPRGRAGSGSRAVRAPVDAAATPTPRAEAARPQPRGRGGADVLRPGQCRESRPPAEIGRRACMPTCCPEPGVRRRSPASAAKSAVLERRVGSRCGSRWRPSLRATAGGRRCPGHCDGGEQLTGRDARTCRSACAPRRSARTAAPAPCTIISTTSSGRVKSARMMPAESVFGSISARWCATSPAARASRSRSPSTGSNARPTAWSCSGSRTRSCTCCATPSATASSRPRSASPPASRPQGRVALRVANRARPPGDRHRGRRARHRFPPDRREGRRDRAACRRRRPTRPARRCSVQLLFEPGFSTADSVTTISGRGMGLSVARETVTALQGMFDVTPPPARAPGSRFRCRSASFRGACCWSSFGDQLYALPSEFGRPRDARRRSIGIVTDRRAARGATAATRRCRWSRSANCSALGDPLVSTGDAGVCVVVVRNAGAPRLGVATHVGVAVDGFVGVNDFVVRNLETGGRDRPAVVRRHQHRRRRAVPGAQRRRVDRQARLGASGVVFRTEQQRGRSSQGRAGGRRFHHHADAGEEHPGGARLRGPPQRRRARRARPAAQRAARHRRFRHRDAACRRIRAGPGHEERQDPVRHPGHPGHLARRRRRPRDAASGSAPTPMSSSRSSTRTICSRPSGRSSDDEAPSRSWSWKIRRWRAS